jgi:hypothetical protein
MRSPSPSVPSPRPARPIALSLAIVLVAAGLAGCRIFTRSKPAAPVIGPNELTEPLQPELGRIISLQPDGRTALVEFVPQYRSSEKLAGRALLARKLDTLQETAQLVASPHQRGRVIGVYVISGQPSPGDEVVIVPEP